MNLDANGLPIQANGDANDQLQRCGMIYTGVILGGAKSLYKTNWWSLAAKCMKGMHRYLYYSLGWMRRHENGDIYNVSADQLISALIAFTIGNDPLRWNLFFACLKRFGFAQNIKDGLGPSTKYKIPDFMLLRALPIFARLHEAFYPITFIADLYLLALVFGDYYYQKTDKDPADVNNTLLTLLLCVEYMQSPVSRFAMYLWPKLCPGIYARLVRYHRAEAGGNPEIAELFQGLCQKWRLI